MTDPENLEEFLIPEEAFARLSDPEVLKRYVEEGKTFQEIIGYSDETMHKFYLAARALFEAQRYKEASDAFLFLTTLDPFSSTYWIGMGLCEQVNEDYQSALVAYGMAVLSNQDDPYAHYYSASCYYGLRDYDNAFNSIEQALQCVKDADMGLKEQILISKSRLVKQHNEG